MQFTIEQVLYFFIFQILITAYKCYDLSCPIAAEWNYRAQLRCQNKITYHCLYNVISEKYEEGCNGPFVARKGSRFVISGQKSRVPCSSNTYQPFHFTNNNSNCTYHKNQCTEEGQYLFSSGGTTTDSCCSCRHAEGYALVVPRTAMFSCKSSLHDDSTCYLKKCRDGLTLLPDFTCGHQLKNVMTDLQHATRTGNNMLYAPHEPDVDYVLIGGRFKHVAYTKTLISFVIVFAVYCVIILKAEVSFIDLPTELVKRYILKQKVEKEADVKQQQELYFFQLICLIYHVATPLARNIFDTEIDPDTFRHQMAKISKSGKIEENRKIEFFHRKLNKSYSSELDLLMMVELLGINSKPKDFKDMEKLEYLFIKITEKSDCLLLKDDYEQKRGTLTQAITSLATTESQKEHVCFEVALIDSKGSSQNAALLPSFIKRLNPLSIIGKNNFLKIVYVLYKAARPAVKDIYDQMEGGWRRSNVLSLEKIVSDSNNDSHLTETEWQYLRKKGDTSSSDLSLKLIIYIVKKYKYPKGMATPDLPELKALTSLDDLRVKIFHSPDGMLSDATFTDIWTRIRTDLTVLKGEKYFQNLSWLKNHKNIMEYLSNNNHPREVRVHVTDS